MAGLALDQSGGMIAEIRDDASSFLLVTQPVPLRIGTVGALVGMLSALAVSTTMPRSTRWRAP